MVWHDIALIRELGTADTALTVLGNYFSVNQLSHLPVGAEFPVSPGMMRVFNAPNSHLALAFFFWDCLSAATGERTVKWAQLIPAESHDVLLIGLGAMVR